MRSVSLKTDLLHELQELQNKTFGCLSGVTLNQQNRSLTIQRVTKEDSGLYTCTVCNSLGCDTAQASLSTEGQSLTKMMPNNK